MPIACNWSTCGRRLFARQITGKQPQKAICPSSYGQIAERLFARKRKLFSIGAVNLRPRRPKTHVNLENCHSEGMGCQFWRPCGGGGRLPDERVKNFLVLGKKFTEKVMGPENLPRKGWGRPHRGKGRAVSHETPHTSLPWLESDQIDLLMRYFFYLVPYWFEIRSNWCIFCIKIALICSC